MTSTVIDAQNKLMADIKVAIAEFLATQEGVELDSLSFDKYPMEEGKNLRCSVAFVDEDGARVTRSI
jgi:hypothetical protein